MAKKESSNEEIEIRGHGWYCPKCRLFRRIRAMYQSGYYERRCPCGFKVRLKISIIERYEYIPEIQDAEAV